MPYQPGRFVRDWDHANTHGMARNDSSRGAPATPAAPSAPPRAAGREPIVSADSSSIGVASRKKVSNCGRLPDEPAIRGARRLREHVHERDGVGRLAPWRGDTDAAIVA